MDSKYLFLLVLVGMVMLWVIYVPRSRAYSKTQPLQLIVAPGVSGGVAKAQFRFELANNIRSFNLHLQFEPGQLLSAMAADFQRSVLLFPEVSLGDHSLNSARDAAVGHIHLIGLAPAAATGSAEIGHLRLHISPNASVGATQTITLTGEINYADTGVVAIEPVVAVVQVIAMDHHVYLPVILRNK